MSKTAELRVLDAEPTSSDVIERLEDVMELAKEGKLSSFAIAVVYRDGTSGHAWSTAPSLSCLLGSVARMQYTLLRFAEE